MLKSILAHPAVNPLMRLRTIAMLFSAAALSACTNLSGLGAASEFQCKAPEGIPCQSISGVHHNERAGNLPAQRMGRAAPADGAAASASTAARGGAWTASGGDSTEGGASQPSPAHAPAAPAYRKATVSAPDRIGPGGLGAIRSDPTVIRIWVAPWEDSDGDLNDQSYVYMQVDAGRWLIEHNRAQIRREFSPRPQQALVAPRGTVVGPAGQGASPAAQQMAPGALGSGYATPLATQAGQAAQPAQPTQGAAGTRMQLPAELAEMLRQAAQRGAAQGAQGAQGVQPGPGAAPAAGKHGTAGVAP